MALPFKTSQTLKRENFGKALVALAALQGNSTGAGEMNIGD